MPDRGPILAGEMGGIDPKAPRVIGVGGRLFAAVVDAVWALEPGVLGRFYDVIMRHEIGVKVDPAVVADIVASRSPGPSRDGENGYERVGSVAVIPIGGIIAKHASQVNGSSQPRGTSTESVRRALAAANGDNAVDSILLHIESPGGYVGGVETLAAEIADQKSSGKPVWSYFDDLGASAAYWIGSQASRVLAGPTAEVGSIGVYMVIPDTSRAYEAQGVHMNLVKYGASKGAGVSGVPVDAATLAKFQQRVDDTGDAFVAAVMRGRGLSREAAVKVATGETWSGGRLMATGLVDELARSAESVIAVMDEKYRRKKAGGGSLSGTRTSETRTAEAQGAGSLGGAAPATPTEANAENQAGADATAASAGDPAEGNVARHLIGIAGIAAGLASLSPDAGGVGTGAGGAAGAATDGNKAAADAATRAERERVTKIQALARRHASNATIQTMATEAINAGTSVSDFGLAAAEKLAPEPTGHVAGGGRAGDNGAGIEVGASAHEKMRDGLALSLLERTAPEVRGALDAGGDRARRMAEVLGFASAGDAQTAMRTARSEGLLSFRLMDIAEMCAMRAHQIASIGQLRARFAGAALFAAAFNSTSDFPLLLSNYAQKRLMAAYTETPTTWQDFCTLGVATDFKDQRILSISEAPNFELVITGQTPGEATFNERQHTIAVETYGKRGSFDFKALRNDDLSAFSRTGQMFGQAAKRVPEDLFYVILQSNSGTGPTMGSVKGINGETLVAAAAMIHSAHLNVGTGGAPSDTTIDEVWQLGRKQKGFGKDQAYLDVMLDRILVPVNLELLANKWYSNVVKPGGSNNENNPVAGRLKPRSSPRLTSTTRWWAFADPAVAPCYQMNFLDGVQTPQFSPINDGDPLNWRFQHTLLGVGVAGIDWYGVVGNAGA